MAIFRLGKAVVHCKSMSVGRMGFKHRAELYINDIFICKATCSYQNRTWESYTFQSVLHKVLEKTDALTKRQKTLFKNKYRR